MPDAVEPGDLKEQIRVWARELGFHAVGFTTPDPPQSAVENLQTWIAKGYDGEMDWIKRRLGERENLHDYYPPVKTVVSVALNYHTKSPFTNKDQPHWSNYAWGDDYHRIIKKKLKALLQRLSGMDYPVNGIGCVDTSPVMDKLWAQQAGLGWQGKHTNLITREYGSWVFLGELLLDVALPPDPPFEEDLCGSCTDCLEACPTGALVEAGQLDARKCISYLTIEYDGEFDDAEGDSLEGWIYGCDICQDVCPWNIKFAQLTDEPRFKARQFFHHAGKEEWRSLTQAKWDKLTTASAARRAGYTGLLRNIRHYLKRLTSS